MRGHLTRSLNNDSESLQKYSHTKISNSVIHSKRWLFLQTSSKAGWWADPISYTMPPILQFKLGKVGVYRAFQFGCSIICCFTLVTRANLIKIPLWLSRQCRIRWAFGWWILESVKSGFLFLESTEVEFGASTPKYSVSLVWCVLLWQARSRKHFVWAQMRNWNRTYGQGHIFHRSNQLHCPHHT